MGKRDWHDPDEGTVTEIARGAALASYVSFGARSGRHDDLVLALALAIWFLSGPHGWGVHTQELRL